MYRNKLSHLLKISKKQYYSDYFLDCAGDGKKIWKGIRQIVRCKATTGQKFIKIVENEKEISNPREVANKFNHYFANIGTDTTSKIPEVRKDPLQYLDQPVLDSFFVSPTSTKEIETVIGNLKSGKAVGPSSLPVDILKLLKRVVQNHWNSSLMLHLKPELSLEILSLQMSFLSLKKALNIALVTTDQYPFYQFLIRS